MMQSRVPIAAIIVAVFGIGCAPSAHAQSAEVEEALRAERLEAVVVEVPPLSARAVVVNQWTAPVNLRVVSSGAGGRVAEHTVAALAELDELLTSIGCPKSNVLKVNAFVLGDDAAALRGVSAKLRAHFKDASHAASHAGRGDGAPLIGVYVAEARAARHFGIAGPAGVALRATVLDPRSSSGDLRMDPGLDYRPDGPRSFMIGPVAVDHGNEDAVQAAFDAVALLMAEIGARRSDIEEVVMYGRFDEATARAVAARFFDGQLPLVDYAAPRLVFLPPTPADAALAVEVTGRVTYRR